MPTFSDIEHACLYSNNDLQKKANSLAYVNGFLGGMAFALSFKRPAGTTLNMANVIKNIKPSTFLTATIYSSYSAHCMYKSHQANKENAHILQLPDCGDHTCKASCRPK